MEQVNCLYCGKSIPADVSNCPHCGAVSHYQRKGWRAGMRKKFIVLFVLLVIFCLFFAFWLPRTPLSTTIG